MSPSSSDRTGRTIAIGDIHGCATALRALLDELRLGPADTLVCLGDYIDRGPDSAEVIDALLELVGSCRVIPLLGNHEVMLLDAVTDPSQMRFWTQHGGLATLASYGGDLSNVPTPHRMFFKHLERWYETDTHLFFHASYDPDQPAEHQDDDVILWEHVTRRVPEPHYSGKTVVVGHTPQPDGQPRDLGHLVLLDTFCYGGQWLTAIDVDSRECWQADNRGRLRPGELQRGAASR